MNILSKLDLNIHEVSITSIISGNPNLSKPSYFSPRWEERMECIACGQFDEMASFFDRHNKANRIIGYVKLHIPQRVIDSIKIVLNKKK